MVCKLIFAVNTEDDSVMKKFLDKLHFLGIQTKKIKSSESYECFESTWNDSEIPELLLKNPRNAGAKLKDLKYNGKSVNCSSVYLLKYQKNLSNAEIGELFNVSESTISRRIKRHLADGNFYEGSEIIF